MKKCLITGGAGLIGSHLAVYLLSKGYEITIIDDLSTGNIQNIPSSIKFIREPLENVNEDVFSDIDVVYHLASISGEAISLYAPTPCFQRNINASYNLILNSMKSDVKRIVFTSSMAVYGNKNSPPFDETDNCDPTDPYGLSKYTIEKLLQVYADSNNIEWTILRLHNVYGPNMNLHDPYRGVIGIFINRLLRGKAPVLYGNGNHLRAFTYIDDIIPYIAKAGFDENCNKEIINLGSGSKTRLLDLAKILCEMTDCTEEIMHFPSRLGEAEYAYTTTKKSEEILGFQDQTDLSKGLLYTLNWAKTQDIEQFKYDLMKLDFDLNCEIPLPWKNRLL
ncbi:NAD-dependent epimerase/dehydratase family protein [uncultured Methanolobus sp.]|uniref:NAD-dependent epimerase/dehydratase family protein n=1 Tax=uncultured Methanolobus sp. TaxID=218300 RepID=UPI002AABAE42|nr:NAD-dependent epimerase/dehydratase family protein [uncultured Methanolobus sp.]